MLPVKILWLVLLSTQFAHQVATFPVTADPDDVEYEDIGVSEEVTEKAVIINKKVRVEAQNGPTSQGTLPAPSSGTSHHNVPNVSDTGTVHHVHSAANTGHSTGSVVTNGNGIRTHDTNPNGGIELQFKPGASPGRLRSLGSEDNIGDLIAFPARSHTTEEPVTEHRHVHVTPAPVPIRHIPDFDSNEAEVISPVQTKQSKKSVHKTTLPPVSHHDDPVPENDGSNEDEDDDEDPFAMLLKLLEEKGPLAMIAGGFALILAAIVGFSMKIISMLKNPNQVSNISDDFKKLGGGKGKVAVDLLKNKLKVYAGKQGKKSGTKGILMKQLKVFLDKPPKTKPGGNETEKIKSGKGDSSEQGKKLKNKVAIEDDSDASVATEVEKRKQALSQEKKKLKNKAAIEEDSDAATGAEDEKTKSRKEASKQKKSKLTHKVAIEDGSDESEHENTKSGKRGNLSKQKKSKLIQKVAIEDSDASGVSEAEVKPRKSKAGKPEKSKVRSKDDSDESVDSLADKPAQQKKSRGDSQTDSKRPGKKLSNHDSFESPESVQGVPNQAKAKPLKREGNKVQQAFPAGRPQQIETEDEYSSGRNPYPQGPSQYAPRAQYGTPTQFGHAQGNYSRPTSPPANYLLPVVPPTAGHNRRVASPPQWNDEGAPGHALNQRDIRGASDSLGPPPTPYTPRDQYDAPVQYDPNSEYIRRGVSPRPTQGQLVAQPTMAGRRQEMSPRNWDNETPIKRATLPRNEPQFKNEDSPKLIDFDAGYRGEPKANQNSAEYRPSNGIEALDGVNRNLRDYDRGKEHEGNAGNEQIYGQVPELCQNRIIDSRPASNTGLSSPNSMQYLAPPALRLSPVPNVVVNVPRSSTTNGPTAFAKYSANAPSDEYEDATRGNGRGQGQQGYVNGF